MQRINENAIPMLTHDEALAITKLKNKLKDKFSVRKLVLFGSKARGDYNSDSDVDLLVLIDEEKTAKTREDLSNIQFDVIMEVLDAPLMCTLENYEEWIDKSTWIAIRGNVEREGIEIEL